MKTEKIHKLVLDIESFEVLRAFIGCNTHSDTIALLGALYNHYILDLDDGKIDDEKTRAVFGALVAIIDASNNGATKPKPQPKPQPKTPRTYKRVAPPRIPRRVKFFIALIYKDAKRHHEDFLELLKTPRAVAQRYGRESECTPLVEAQAQEWALRVKPESALVEARKWLKENREGVELGRYKDTPAVSVYDVNTF